MLSATTEQIRTWFWSPSFWLPHGYTWKDIELSNTVNYPDWRDIWTYPITICFILLVLRAYVLNPYIYANIGRYCGLIVKKRRGPPPNKILESIFVSNNGCVPAKVIQETAVSLQLTQRQVERWIRSRSSVNTLTKEDKFNECAYIFTYHCLTSVSSLLILVWEPWLWNISLCFKDYPFHGVDRNTWWLYMTSAGFYWSQLLWQMKHSHGRDANLAYVHHVFTLFLINFSWMCNFVRIGSLVILVHEFGGDVFLQLAKMCRIIKYDKPMDVVYVLFVFSWLSARMVVYPIWICKYIFLEATDEHFYMPAANFFNFLLFGLLLINCGWTCFLLISIYKRITEGKIENSAESDSSSSERNTEEKEE